MINRNYSIYKKIVISHRKDVWYSYERQCTDWEFDHKKKGTVYKSYFYELQSSNIQIIYTSNYYKDEQYNDDDMDVIIDGIFKAKKRAILIEELLN